MFFKKKTTSITWAQNDESELKGKIILRVLSVKRYDELLFKTPHNNPACFDYVPQAIRIKGEIIKQKEMHFSEKFAYFLVPKPILEKMELIIVPGDQIELELTANRKCIKLEKV